MEFGNWFLYINYAILIYAALYILLKTTTSLYSIWKMKRYYKKNFSYWDNDIEPEKLKDAPSISIVASAYNETDNIVSCVKSFMAQDYDNFEVIIVNDGSTDDTLDKLVKTFGVRKMKHKMPLEAIPTEFARGVYRKNNLYVIDKDNGGMADGQNCGINLANKDLVFVTDADCIMEKDALKRTVMPFIEEEDTVGVGGVIQMINDCEVEDGVMVKRNLPKRMLPIFQTLEYLKSYIINRMGWQDAKTLLVASGAYGLYDKKILRAVGGYQKKMLSDDMYITMRINEYLYNIKRKGKIRFIPDPLVWTEAPSKMKNYASQRIRWGTGIMQSMWRFKKFFMNPKYRTLGLITFPYHIFFVWLTPIVEMFALIYGAYVMIMHQNFDVFLPFMLLVYLFGVIFNLSTVFTFNKYKTYDSKDKNKLLLYSLIEPLFYHWINSFYCVIGYFKFAIGRIGHTKLNREGIKDKNNK